MILKRKLEPYPMCLTGALRTAVPRSPFAYFPVLYFFHPTLKAGAGNVPSHQVLDNQTVHLAMFAGTAVKRPSTPKIPIRFYMDIMIACVYIFIF